MEELEKIEAKEATKVGSLGSEMLLIYPSSNIGEPLIFIVDWSFIPLMSLFSLRLFTDFGIPDIVETPLDIRLNS